MPLHSQLVPILMLKCTSLSILPVYFCCLLQLPPFTATPFLSINNPSFNLIHTLWVAELFHGFGIGSLTEAQELEMQLYTMKERGGGTESMQSIE